MFKQLLLGIIAVSGLAVFWSDVNAQDCVRWRRVGGSEVCVRYATGSIILEVAFKQDCGPEGENCSAQLLAETDNSVVFCRNLVTNAIRKSTIPCTADVTFEGFADQCEPKHPGKDNDGVGGKGHDKGKHACTSTTQFEPQNPDACQLQSCNPGEVVVDVTPIDMNTAVSLSVFEGGPASLASETAEEGSRPECPPGSSFCQIEHHCTIDPKKIQFDKIRSYQCEITFAGGGGG